MNQKVGDWMGYGFFGIMDTIFPVMFVGVFLLVAGMIIVTLVRSASEWSANNHSPVLSVDAKVVSKRTNVSAHANQNGGHSSSTTYYVTFQVESGDRLELRMSGREFGTLAEGDKGKLTFQRTRYRGFERKLM